MWITLSIATATILFFMPWRTCVKMTSSSQTDEPISTNPHLDRLQKALFILALAQTHPHLFESKLEDLYDGSTLPNMSGRSTTQACFSYFDKHQEAIDKFLNKNFATFAQNRAFFKTYLAHLTRYNYACCRNPPHPLDF